jgi:hypothetical protein
VPAFTPTPAPTTTTNACNVAHPATLTPLTGTPDPALFYLTGKGGYQSGTSSTSLVRYDLTTGKKTTLVPAANDSSILDVKLSPDKQWLLFSTYTPFSTQGQTLITLRVIRTDGSLLQTLYSYCSGSYPGGTSILAWSPNEREVAFAYISENNGIKILDLTTGNVQTVLTGTASISYRPASWVNNQELLVEQLDGAHSATNKIYLLDTSKGANQPLSNLTALTSIQEFCGNMALSSDGTQLFSSSCTAFNGNCQGNQVQGPSTVSLVPVSGGATKTIYSSQSQAITALAPASATSLLIYIENTTGDLSQDGLWKINTDGSGLTRLTTASPLACQYSTEPYPFTQIASNSQSYALLYLEGGVQKLAVGSLTGGAATTIATSDFSNANIFVLAGIGVA